MPSSEPIRNGTGASILGPRNVPLELENPSLLASPPTDAGTIPNLKFSFSATRNRLVTGGWAREATERELPVATTLAGVNMRLEPGGIRELHWHKEAEWAYMIAGHARITAVDAHGRNFIDDVGPGDLWNFPAGIPHSIQGLDEGCEFLLVFDDGSFSENETFLITDWFAHTPRDVLAQNFGVSEDAFRDIPLDFATSRYIFAGAVPPPLAEDAVGAPAGTAPTAYSYKLSEQQPIKVAGGQVRIVDSSSFPAASTIAAALVEVEPGGLRELHWHPNTDEWQYYISGHARMTVFASSGKARTFDYQAGDVGYVPFAMGHYVQNTGDEPLRFLEMFRSDRFADISLNQWMALTPPELVKAHLNLDDPTIAALKKDKPVIVPGARRHAELPVLPEWTATTIGVLSTLDGAPYAIPVTAPVRAGDRRIMFALGRERGSLARLVENPQVALFIGGEHNEAFTARGRAQIAAEDMPVPGMVAVALEVEEIDDHRQKAFSVESGIGVEWHNERAHEQLRNHVDALRELGQAM
jgi:oxalate decarboxylase